MAKWVTKQLLHGWVMSQIWASHVTYMSESCHIYGWVMLHIWVSHVTHMGESCHTYGCVTLHICVSHVTHMGESCFTYVWVMPHIWRIRVTHMEQLLCVCVMTPSCVINDSFRSWHGGLQDSCSGLQVQWYHHMIWVRDTYIESKDLKKKSSLQNSCSGLEVLWNHHVIWVRDTYGTAAPCVWHDFYVC